MVRWARILCLLLLSARVPAAVPSDARLTRAVLSVAPGARLLESTELDPRLPITSTAQTWIQADFDGDGNQDLAALVVVSSRQGRAFFLSKPGTLVRLWLVVALDRPAQDPQVLVLAKDEVPLPSPRSLVNPDEALRRRLGRPFSFLLHRARLDAAGYWWESDKKAFNYYWGLGSECGF